MWAGVGASHNVGGDVGFCDKNYWVGEGWYFEGVGEPGHELGCGFCNPGALKCTFLRGTVEEGGKFLVFCLVLVGEPRVGKFPARQDWICHTNTGLVTVICVVEDITGGKVGIVFTLE